MITIAPARPTPAPTPVAAAPVAAFAAVPAPTSYAASDRHAVAELTLRVEILSRRLATFERRGGLDREVVARILAPLSAQIARL